MKTQLLRSRNAKMQKCRKMFFFCTFAFLHFCFIFAQTDGGLFTDPRDGQTYKTVIMPDGKRWMAENLKYTQGLQNPVFPNIPASSLNTFVGLKNYYYCPGPGPLNASVGQADPLACEYWGCLYPWWVAYANATNTGVNATPGAQGICPSGWHLPSFTEWNNLITSVGGSANAGKLLKDTARGTFANNQAWKKWWTGSALQNNDTYGFSALAAGSRTTAGAYSGNGTQALFWTSSPNSNGTQAYSQTFTNTSIASTSSSVQNRADALSVRCVEGHCDEGYSISLSAMPSCSKRFDTIEYSDSYTKSKTQFYSINLTPTGVSWTYSASVISCEFGSVSISQPASNVFTFKMNNLTAASHLKTFVIEFTATEPTHCTFKHRDTFMMKYTAGSLATVDTTSATKTMTDPRDGRVYKIVKMPDGYWWMAENLNYQKHLTRYADATQPAINTDVPAIYLGSFWCPGASGALTSEPADCEGGYGALYAWSTAAALDGTTWVAPTFFTTNTAYGNPTSLCSRGICPQGWHIPSDGEWGDMLNAVETGTKNHNTTPISNTIFGGATAGQRLKSTSPSWAGTNVHGFNLFPSGHRTRPGSGYASKANTAFMWTGTQVSSLFAFERRFMNNSSSVMHWSANSGYGFSVRCMMD